MMEGQKSSCPVCGVLNFVMFRRLDGKDVRTMLCHCCLDMFYWDSDKGAWYSVPRARPADVSDKVRSMLRAE